MIITVHTSGWYADSLKFAKVALDLNQTLFIKDTEGNFQKVTSVAGIQWDTPLFLEQEMFLDTYALAEHFDMMLASGKEGVYLLIDSKGGRFKQR